MTGFQEQFQLDAAACETVLKQLIVASEGPASQLRDAMEYGLLNGWQAYAGIIGSGCRPIGFW